MSMPLIHGLGPTGQMVPVKVAADGTLAGGGGGGGTGDASAANQVTQIAQVGPTTDAAAAANGTGNYSIIAGIKRALLNWAELLTNRLPASLGAKAGSGSLSVVPATDAAFGLAPSGFRSTVDVTRGSGTTVYAANDVVGASPSAVLTFANAGPANANVIITSVDLRYDVTAAPVGMTSFRLYLYSATPPSALADNAAFDIPAGDRSALIGFIDLGTISDLGSTLFLQADGVNKQVQLSGTSLFGYLVTAGGYTPAAAGETFRIVLRTVTP